MISPIPEVSVIVPVYNEAAVLERTVATMLGQTFNGQLEFIFVDGGSDDGSREILERLALKDARVSVLTNPQRVEPAALNIGVSHASGTYLALLNAHCRFPDDYLDQGVKRLSEPGATWVCGPALPEGQDPFSRAVARALVSPLGAGGSHKWRSPDAPPEPEVELDTGLFAGVVRRQTLVDLGPFDVEWTVNHDSEMAGRVLDSGGRIVQLSSMGAVYHPRSTLRGLWRQYWRFGLYRVRTSQRHPVALRPFHIAAGALALTPVIAVLLPRRYALPARLALVLYAAAIARTVTAGNHRSTLTERASVAMALTTMHFGWGVGFLSGVARFGPPVDGLLHVLRIRRDQAR
ncbi:MAG: glycosyltransferase [Solirubrobacteraceae bacterium]